MKTEPRITLYQNDENKGALFTKTRGVLLTKGKYILKLKINGIYDGAELNAEEQFMLTVNPLTTELTAETEDIFEGETAIVNVTLPSDVTGNIIVRLDGDELYTVAAGEKLSFEFENLKAGIHGVEIIFSDDPNYADNSTFIGFIVNEVVPEPVDSQMNMTIDENTEVGKNPVAKIELPEDGTGKITIKIRFDSFYSGLKEIYL